MTTSSVPFSGKTAADLLACAPVGILTIDTEGRIGWVNPALEALLQLPAADLVGRDPATSSDLAELVGEQSLLTLRDSRGNVRYLNHHRSGEQTGNAEIKQIHFYAEASGAPELERENAALKRELEQLSLRNPDTGLLNHRAITLLLEPQVARSRRYDNPLSVAVLAVHEPDTADRSQVTGRRVGQLLKDQLRWADLVGHDERGRYVLVLPETDEQAALGLVEKLAAALKAEPGVDGFHFGVATWGKRDNAAGLLARADAALESAIEGPGAKLVATA